MLGELNDIIEPAAICLYMASCLALDMPFCRTEAEQAVNAGSPFSPRFLSTADDVLVALVTNSWGSDSHLFSF